MASQVNLDDLVITESAWPYLVIQNGALDFLKHDRAMWTAAYKQKLIGTYENIAPWLPESCTGWLDVGAGMGGIDILISREYGNGPVAWLLDGKDDEPALNLHRVPFSHFEAAALYLKANGVRKTAIVDARAANRMSDGFDVTYLNLVVSFGAWCFHFPPSEYLDVVCKMTASDARLILEVRRDKPEWRAELARAFKQVATIAESKKWTRVVYDRR